MGIKLKSFDHFSDERCELHIADQVYDVTPAIAALVLGLSEERDLLTEALRLAKVEISCLYRRLDTHEDGSQLELH